MQYSYDTIKNKPKHSYYIFIVYSKHNIANDLIIIKKSIGGPMLTNKMHCKNIGECKIEMLHTSALNTSVNIFCTI